MAEHAKDDPLDTPAEWLSWLKAALIRAVKTAAQAFLAIAGAGVAFSDVDWKMTLSATGMAAVLSLVTSIKGLPEVSDGDSVAKIASNAK